MKVVIAGSRDVTDPEVIEWAIEDSGFEVTEVISGCAKGVDTFAMMWAERNSVPVEQFEPDWTNLTHPNALIKRNKWGQKYDARAGLRRNELMAVHAEALIAIWDGRSTGTKHMIKMAKKRELPIYVFRTDIGTKSGHIKYETRAAFYRRLVKEAKDTEFKIETWQERNLL